MTTIDLPCIQLCEELETPLFRVMHMVKTFVASVIKECLAFSLLRPSEKKYWSAKKALGLVVYCWASQNTIICFDG
jgi:hypothetical protein